MFELSTETVTFLVELIEHRGKVGHRWILAKLEREHSSADENPALPNGPSRRSNWSRIWELWKQRSRPVLSSWLCLGFVGWQGGGRKCAFRHFKLTTEIRRNESH